MCVIFLLFGAFIGKAHSFYWWSLAVMCTYFLIMKWFCCNRLSFALAASQIKEKARVVAMDMRGHGKSYSENDLDLSIEVLIRFMLYSFTLSLLKFIIFLSPTLHPTLLLVLRIYSMGCRLYAMMSWLFWRLCMGILLLQLSLLATGSSHLNS